GIGARLGGLDLLLGDPDLLLLGALELLGRLEVQIGDAVGRRGGRIAEGDVDEVLDLFRRRPAAVRPEMDDPLGPLDVVEQVAQALHEAAPGGITVLAVDDLVADVERAQLLEDLAVAVHRLRLELLPRRLLDLALDRAARRLATAGLGLRLPRLVHQLVPLAQQAVDAAEGVDHGAGQLDFLLLGELLFVDIDDLFDGDVAAPQQLAQLAEPLEGQVGAEDGHRDLVLALLDAL